MEELKSNDPIKVTSDKVKYIISKNVDNILTYDYIYILQIKELFIQTDNNFKLAIKIDTDIAKLIDKIIDIIHFVFLIPKDKRESYYLMNIAEIKHIKTFNKKIEEIELVRHFKIDFKNANVKRLSSLILASLAKKPNMLFYEYIDYLLLHVSFIPGLDWLLKFQLYQILYLYYLNPINVPLEFSPNEINVSDDIPLNILYELFSKNLNDSQSIVISVIFLNYGSLSNAIKNYKLDEIITSINVVSENLTKHRIINNQQNIALFVERVTLMFLDEIRRPKIIETNNKSKNKLQELKSDENALKYVKDNTKEADLKRTGNINKLNNNTKDDHSVKGEDKIIKPANIQINQRVSIADNNNLNQLNEFNKYLNNIINYINNNNMGNESIRNDLKNLQNVMSNIADRNKFLEEKIEKMNDDLSKQIEDLSKKNENYEQEIEALKEDVEILKEDSENMKNIIKNIQYRDISKNFLRPFKKFLDDDDWKLIRINRQRRGEIIASKIQKAYPNADKLKMSIVLDLIKSADNLIRKGNYFAHSRTLDLYEDEIINYKEKKQVKTLNSPVAFCFLLNLGISQSQFEEAYSFLDQYFDNDLIPTDQGTLLNSYFK